jgi:hypothetical protein
VVTGYIPVKAEDAEKQQFLKHAKKGSTGGGDDEDPIGIYTSKRRASLAQVFERSKMRTVQPVDFVDDSAVSENRCSGHKTLIATKFLTAGGCGQEVDACVWIKPTQVIEGRQATDEITDSRAPKHGYPFHWSRRAPEEA